MIWIVDCWWTGKTSIWGSEEPGEATGIGSWGVREETIAYRDAVYARTRPFTTQGSCKPITWYLALPLIDENCLIYQTYNRIPLQAKLSLRREIEI